MDIYCTLLYIFNSSTYLQQSLQLSNSFTDCNSHMLHFCSVYSASFCADCTCTVAYRRCRKRVERGVSHQSNQQRMQMISLATFNCLWGRVTCLDSVQIQIQLHIHISIIYSQPSICPAYFTGTVYFSSIIYKHARDCDN